jgi:hypothetical protein
MRWVGGCTAIGLQQPVALSAQRDTHAPVGARLHREQRLRILAAAGLRHASVLS